MAAASAQTVIDIPLEQFPRLSVVATTVTIDLDQGSNLLGSDLVVEGGDGNYSYLWTDADGQELSNESTLRVGKAGDYYLKVSDGHDCQVITKFTVTGTSTIDMLASRGLHIGFAGQSLVMNYDTTPVQVRIVNTAGQLERKISRMPQNGITTDVSNLPAGTYLVCVTFPDEKAIVVKLNKKD